MGILHKKGDSAAVIKLTLRWGDYPAISGWTQWNCKCLYKRETRVSESERDRFVNAIFLSLKMEEGVRSQGMQVASGS